jgi:Zn-dependent protease
MGPASNLLLAVCAVLAYKAATLAAFLQAQFQGTLLDFLLYALKINLFLAFFNLLPVHPLDGSKVLGGLLPRAWERAYGRHAPYGAFIILLLISTKAFGPLVLLPSRLVLSAFARLGLIG